MEGCGVTYFYKFSKYSGDLNTNHLDTINIWIPNFLKFGFQMVGYSNGRSMGNVLCTRPTIQIPDQWIRSKMASICPVFKWLGCPVFKWHSKTRPFGIQPLLDQSNTRLVQYSDPHCLLKPTISRFRF